MLFLKPMDVTRVWKEIVAGVIDNRLGSSCKVATDDESEERLSAYFSVSKGKDLFVLISSQSVSTPKTSKIPKMSCACSRR